MYLPAALLNDERLHQRGVVYARKRNGRKLLFVIAGPTLIEAAGYLIPKQGYVYFHVGDTNGDMVGIVAQP